MDRFWLKNYPDGVPSDIDPDSYSSIVELFEMSCDKFGDNPAYANLGTNMTYDETRHKAKAFAAYLQQAFKVKHGDRIAVMMPNLLQYPVAIFGAMLAGMTVVNVNPLYTAHELRHQLNDAGVDVVVVLANMAHVLAEALPDTKVKHVIVTEVGDLYPQPKRTLVNLVVKYIKRMVPSFKIENTVAYRDVLNRGAAMAHQEVKLTGEDIAFLQYTGGTTGVAKGAILTHRNLIANVLQCKTWLEPSLCGTRQEIIITALPLYHIFSLTCNCLTFFVLGGLNVLITNPRDIKGFVKELGNYKFTSITAVNTLFNALLHAPGFADLDFSELSFCLSGGMALQKSVAEHWHQVTGRPIIEGYGLTETSPVVTINPTNITEFTGAIGLPLASTFISIRDDDDNLLPLGQPGEICAKGPQIMRGYWNKPNETADIFTKSGWLRTGDVGVMDEMGSTKIVDRKKDMILVSGFNVYPNEIEDAIALHPGVLEVAVIGVPDDTSGEVVKAFIVRKEENLSEKDIVTFCRDKLTRYKVPKRIEFRDELPKSNVGKILRRELRDEAVSA